MRPHRRRQRQGIDKVKESRFMSRLERLRIWDDSAIRGALSWYLDVAENRRPAKFRIAATVATQLDPATSSEDALWVELKRLTPIFVTRWQAIRAGEPLPQGTRSEPVGAVPRTCLPHARPLQFLPLELPRRPGGGRQVRRLQACLRFAGQLAFPSYRGGAVLSRHARLGHDLFHLVQHAVRLLPEWGHQH